MYINYITLNEKLTKKEHIKMKKLFKNNPLRSESNVESSDDHSVNAIHHVWQKNSRSLNMLSTELERAGYGRMAPCIVDTIRETYKPEPSRENMSPSALSEALHLIRKEARIAIQSYRVTQKNYNEAAYQNTQKRLQETLSMYQIVSEAFYSLQGVLI